MTTTNHWKRRNRPVAFSPARLVPAVVPSAALGGCKISAYFQCCNVHSFAGAADSTCARATLTPTTQNGARLKLTKLLPPTRIHHTSVSFSPTATMPQEVSDIKQFIEICRRKDASCECHP